jgi:hypothetical protein
VIGEGEAARVGMERVGVVQVQGLARERVGIPGHGPRQVERVAEVGHALGGARGRRQRPHDGDGEIGEGGGEAAACLHRVLVTSNARSVSSSKTGGPYICR